MIKNLSANVGDVRDVGLIPGSERSPGEENGNLLQYSCWRIPWTEELGGLHGVTRVRHNWARTGTLQHCTIWGHGTMCTEEPQNWKIQCKGIFQSVAKMEGHFSPITICKTHMTTGLKGRMYKNHRLYFEMLIIFVHWFEYSTMLIIY